MNSPITNELSAKIFGVGGSYRTSHVLVVEERRNLNYHQYLISSKSRDDSHLSLAALEAHVDRCCQTTHDMAPVSTPVLNPAEDCGSLLRRFPEGLCQQKSLFPILAIAVRYWRWHPTPAYLLRHQNYFRPTSSHLHRHRQAETSSGYLRLPSVAEAKVSEIADWELLWQNFAKPAQLAVAYD